MLEPGARDPSPPGGSLADALAAAVAELRLPYSRRFVRERLARHPQPHSLLAAVELAPRLGLAARAYRCDIDALRESDLPLLLHLGAGDGGAFVVLTAIEGTRFTLHDPGSGTRVLKENELDRLWSGVAVHLAPSDESAEPERRLGLHRTRDHLGDALARGLGRFRGLAKGAAMRGVAVALLIALLGIGSLRRAMSLAPGDLRDLVLTGLALVGSALGFLLDRVSRDVRLGRTSRLAARFCGRTGLLDCDSVLHSAWAGLGRWSLASLGSGWLISALVLMAASALLGPGGSRAGEWVAWTFLLAAPVALLLLAIQAWPLARVCGLCTAFDLVVLAGAVVAWRSGSLTLLAPGGGDLSGLSPWAVAHALLFLGGLGFLVPGIEARERLRTERQVLGDMLSTPLGALALLAATPTRLSTLPAAPVRWGNPTAEVQVAAFVNPLCEACGAVVESMNALVAKRGDRVQVAFYFVPKTGSRKPADLELSTALTELATVAGEEAAWRAFRTIKSDPRSWLLQAEAGSEALVASLGAPGEDRTGQPMPRARRLVGDMAEALERARVGIPAVFVNGRYFLGSLRDLEVLVDDHLDLLTAVVC